MENSIVGEYLGRDEATGGHNFRFKSEGSPPDDGIMDGACKIWLTVKNGESTWAVVYLGPTLVYVNSIPRVIALPGDKVFVSVGARGRQSIKVTRGRAAITAGAREGRDTK